MAFTSFGRAVTTTLTVTAVAATAAFFSIATPAQAQTAAEEEAPNPWRKLCVTEGEPAQEICITRQEARNQEGQPIAAASIRVAEGQTPRILFEVPTAVLLPPGIGFAIDENQPQQAIFIICTQQFCSAEAEIDQALIDQMKAGNNLMMQVVNRTEQAVAIGFTLVGFTAAFDGEGQNLADYQAGREDVQRGLQERAEQAREQLQQQQQGDSQ